ncbi:MAG: phosphodiester glycosidase family protein [Patescibacteria group bacterium]
MIQKLNEIKINDNVARLEYRLPEPSNGQIILYKFDADKFNWRFENSKEPKTMAQWADTFPEKKFIMNGVYFHEDNLPSGLLISKGEQIGLRQFDLNLSGIISLSPTVEIIQTERTDIQLERFKEAAQSYPFLIKNGQVAIETDSEQYAVRSFIAIDQEGFIYLGVVQNVPISLFGLAERMLAMDVPWATAINLDGGGSTGLVAEFDENYERIDSLNPVPNIILLTEK